MEYYSSNDADNFHSVRDLALSFAECQVLAACQYRAVIADARS